MVRLKILQGLAADNLRDRSTHEFSLKMSIPKQLRRFYYGQSASFLLMD